MATQREDACPRQEEKGEDGNANGRCVPEAREKGEGGKAKGQVESSILKCL
ncbi:hypothetical protein J7E71_26340 [Mesobacillus foraminis]|uniref:hypothetical protein n=1 Tax=Mesobacillus foraminis TaxID=279826 RepID=UPI001BE9AC71|nr:hypothetical protein [Mesobacillus foraminis]MBT2759390.1 hypothetical protein [Mesobacillus foraminis]